MKTFCQLAVLLSTKPHIGGWFASEKLDGQRCLWDGGASRGVLKRDVPWANMHRDRVGTDDEIATGLWSRMGNVIHAPGWWLDTLDSMILDGELCHPLGRQTLRSIVSGGGDWTDVSYTVFDAPCVEQVFGDRTYEVRYGRDVRRVSMIGCVDWVRDHGISGGYHTHRDAVAGIGISCREVSGSDPVARAEVEEWAAKIVAAGGEGVIVRHPDRGWTPERVPWVCKVKPRQLSEAVVLGVTRGTGRLIGKIGALIVEDDGVQFELGTGLTDLDRSRTDWIGKTVSYRYRGRTDGGLPVEASVIGGVS